MMGAELRSMRKIKETRNNQRKKFLKHDDVFNKLFEYKTVKYKVGSRIIKKNMLTIKDTDLYRLGADLIEEDIKRKRIKKVSVDDYDFMARYLAKRHNNFTDSLDLNEYFK